MTCKDIQYHLRKDLTVSSKSHILCHNQISTEKLDTVDVVSLQQ